MKQLLVALLAPLLMAASSIQPSAVTRTAATDDPTPGFGAHGVTATNQVLPPTAFLTLSSTGSALTVQQSMRLGYRSASVQSGDLIEAGVCVRKVFATGAGIDSNEAQSWVEVDPGSGSFSEISGTRISWHISADLNGLGNTSWWPAQISGTATGCDNISEAFVQNFIIPKLNPNTGSVRFRWAAQICDNGGGNCTTSTGGLYTVTHQAKLLPPVFGNARSADYSPSLGATAAQIQNLWVSTAPYYARTGGGPTEGCLYPCFKAANRPMSDGTANLTGSGHYSYRVGNGPDIHTAPSDNLGYIASQELEYLTGTSVGPGDGGAEGGNLTVSADGNVYWDSTAALGGNYAIFNWGVGTCQTGDRCFGFGDTTGNGFIQQTSYLKLKAGYWYNFEAGLRGSGILPNETISFESGDGSGTPGIIQTQGTTYSTHGFPVGWGNNTVLRMRMTGASDTFVDDVRILNPTMELVKATAVSAGDANVETMVSLDDTTGLAYPSPWGTTVNLAYDGGAIARREQADIGLRLVAGDMTVAVSGYKFHANDTAASQQTNTHRVDLLLEKLETYASDSDNSPVTGEHKSDRVAASGGTRATEGGYAFNKNVPIRVKVTPFNDNRRDGTDAAASNFTGNATVTEQTGDPLVSSITATWDDTQRLWEGDGTTATNATAVDAGTLRASVTVNSEAANTGTDGKSADDAELDTVTAWHYQHDEPCADLEPVGFDPPANRPDQDTQTKKTNDSGVAVKRFNRGEVAYVETCLFNNRGQLLDSESGLSVLAGDRGNIPPAGTLSTTSSDGTGQVAGTYTIPTDDNAATGVGANTIGTDGVDSEHKSLIISRDNNQASSTLDWWGVSRKLQLDQDCTGAISGDVHAYIDGAEGTRVYRFNRDEVVDLRGCLHYARSATASGDHPIQNSSPITLTAIDSGGSDRSIGAAVTDVTGRLKQGGQDPDYTLLTTEQACGSVTVDDVPNCSGAAPGNTLGTDETDSSHRHLRVTFVGNGVGEADDSGSAVSWGVSDVILIDKDVAGTDNDGAVNTDFEVYNRGETVNLDYFTSFARGDAYDGGRSVRTRVLAVDDGETYAQRTEDDQTLATTAAGKLDYSYLIAAADQAELDGVGSLKRVLATEGGNASNLSNEEWGVSNLLYLADVTTGTNQNLILDKTSAINSLHVYNRGESPVIQFYVTKANGLALVSATGITVNVLDDTSRDNEHVFSNAQTDGAGLIRSVTSTDLSYLIANTDLAAATNAGRDKVVTLDWFDNQVSDSNPDLKVSSKLFLDMHPQISSTLSPDDFDPLDPDNPAASQDDNEQLSPSGFVILGDTIKMAYHVECIRMNGETDSACEIDTSGSAISQTATDPDGLANASLNLTTDTGAHASNDVAGACPGGGSPCGWSPVTVQQPTAPAGDWTFDSEVTFNGNTATDQESLTFITPLTSNLATRLIHPASIVPGTTFEFHYQTETDDVATVPQSIPVWKISRYDDNSTPSDHTDDTWVDLDCDPVTGGDQAECEMYNVVDETQSINGALYYFEFAVPAGEERYNIFTKAQLNGNGIRGNWTFLATEVLAGSDPVFDGTDFATGLPFK